MADDERTRPSAVAPVRFTGKGLFASADGSRKLDRDPRFGAGEKDDLFDFVSRLKNLRLRLDALKAGSDRSFEYRAAVVGYADPAVGKIYDRRSIGRRWGCVR
jgi:hypothetical protein